MRSDVSGGIDVDGIGRVEGPGIDELEDQEHNPIDGGDDAVLGIGGGCVVSPNGGTGMMGTRRGRSEGVVGSGDEEYEVGDEGEDAMDNESLRRVVLAAGEWVICFPSSISYHAWCMW